MKIWYLAFVFLLAQQAGLPAAFLHSQAQQQTSINLTMEHRHTLRELLKDSSVARQAVPGLEIGSILPPAVELRPLPADVAQRIPQIKNHAYLLTDKSIALVDAQERKVVEIIAD